MVRGRKVERGFPVVSLKEPIFALASPLVFLAVVLFCLAIGAWKAKMLSRFGNRATLERFSKLSTARSRWISNLSLAAVLALAMIAAAEPNRDGKWISGNTLNAILVCDASISMKAEDYPGDIPRFRVGIAAMQALLEAFPDGEFGVVAFTDKAVSYGPSRDSQTLVALVAYVCDPSRPRDDGSSATAGLFAAINLAKENSIGTIIIFSDGGDPMAAGEPKTIVTLARQSNIRVVSIGFGDSRAVRVPARDPFTGELLGYYTHDGQPVFTRLEPASVKLIAEETTGEYRAFSPGNEAELVTLVKSRQWNDRPTREKGKESLVWVPLLAMLAVFFAWLLAKKAVR